MEKIRLKNEFVDSRDEMDKCPVCEIYVHKDEGFTCPRCRKGSLCRRHRVSGMKECASCVFDIRKKDLNALKVQEESLKQFLRFLQFLFLVFAVFFVALKFGFAEYVEILRTPMIDRIVMYLGGLAVAGYILFTIILYNQRGKIDEVELFIRKLEVRR